MLVPCNLADVPSLLFYLIVPSTANLTLQRFLLEDSVVSTMMTSDLSVE